jgi:hypothetical protein
MTEIYLFDDITRNDLNYSENNENPYDFYNRSSRYKFVVVRELLNKWFSEYPDAEKNDLKNRFRKTFDSAFYELFLYKLFVNLGFQVQIHPKLPHSKKRPDFLITKGELEIYVEAKIDYDKSTELIAIERKISQFYDDLNKLKVKGFYFALSELYLKNNSQPSAKKVIKFIEKKIDKLNPELIKQLSKENHSDQILCFHYDDDNLSIKITPLPVDNSLKDAFIENPIGMHPFKSFTGSGEQSMENSIKKKAKRYGKLDKPFIVCLNVISEKFPKSVDFERLIWGVEALICLNKPEKKSFQWSRKDDSIFLNNKKITLENLSGVLITRVYPNSIPNSKYHLFKHPYSSNTFDFNRLGLKYSYEKKDIIHRTIGDDFDEIFNMDKNWLIKK